MAKNAPIEKRKVILIDFLNPCSSFFPFNLLNIGRTTIAANPIKVVKAPIRLNEAV